MTTVQEAYRSWRLAQHRPAGYFGIRDWSAFESGWNYAVSKSVAGVKARGARP